MSTEDGMYNKVVVNYVKNIKNVRYEDVIKRKLYNLLYIG